MAISVKAAAILAIIVESILYGQYVCTTFIPCTFEDRRLLTRNLHLLIRNHIVVPDISAQLCRGRSSYVNCCLLVIPPGYHGGFSCPFNDVENCLPWVTASDCRCQSCVARLHFFRGSRPVFPGYQQKYVQKCIIRIADYCWRCNRCQLSLFALFNDCLTWPY